MTSSFTRDFERRPALFLVLGLLLFLVSQVVAATDSRLPDGSAFHFWEEPLTFSKTYYVDGNPPRGDDRGPGSLERPFRTIGKAAAILQPGERVVIAGGTYRESIRPARGGSGPDKMISYEAAPGAVVIVKASEVLRDWQPSTEPMRGVERGAVKVWKHELSGELFSDAYNPFAMVNVPGDWSWLDTQRVDMGPYFRRRGMVFVDGKPLEPVEQYRELGNVPLHGAPQASGQPPRRTGLPSRSRRGPIMQEIGGSPERNVSMTLRHRGTAI